MLDNAAVVEKDDGSEHLEWLEEALKAAVKKTVYAAEKPPTAWEPNPAETFWNTAVLERLRKTERAAETIYKDLVDIVSKALALVEVAEKHHKKNAQKRQELRELLERVKSYRMGGLEVLDSLAEDLTAAHVHEKAEMQQANVRVLEKARRAGAKGLDMENAQNLASIAQAGNRAGIDEGNIATIAAATMSPTAAPELQNETPSLGRLSSFAHSDK